MATDQSAQPKVLGIRPGKLVDGLPSFYYMDFDVVLTQLQRDGVKARLLELPATVSSQFWHGTRGTVFEVHLPPDLLERSLELLARLREAFKPQLPYTANTDVVRCQCDSCQGDWWVIITIHNTLSAQERGALLSQFRDRAADGGALWLPGDRHLSVKVPVGSLLRQQAIEWMKARLGQFGIAGTVNGPGRKEILNRLEAFH